MLNVVVLSENHSNCSLKGEPGLSLFVNFNGYKFLFDTGASDLFIQNAKKLGIDVEDVDNVVISHGHSDHTNGIKFLQMEKRIIAHPAIFKERYSMKERQYAGFPMSEKALRSKHNVFLTSEPNEFTPNIWFLGEIPMTVDFEKNGYYSTTLDDEYRIQDKTEDDSGIVFVTPKGLIVFTGCGHKGICNTIEYAKKVTGKSQVYAVLGGFHLKNLEAKKPVIDQTIDYLKRNRIRNLYLGHCIDDDVINYMQEKMPSAKINRLAVGKMFDIELSKEENLAEKL